MSTWSRNLRDRNFPAVIGCEPVFPASAGPGSLMCDLHRCLSRCYPACGKKLTTRVLTMSQSPATSSIKELTIRGIIIGGIITVVFTAANVYLGLKVGITFATSSPAAVISMAILRRFADHTV